MLEPIVMGIDAGNTKTLAVVVDKTGRVLGYGRSAQANIYVDFTRAMGALRHAYQEALVMAGVQRVAHLAISASGADWPEDFTALRSGLQAVGMVEDAQGLSVVNDAVGALWSGSATGEGVAVAVGTSAGVGARWGERVWHSSYWQEAEGAVQLGRCALRTVYRSELNLEPHTSLTRAVLDLFDLPSVEDVLHAFTARKPLLGEQDAAKAARLLLDEAERGDELARRIVREHAKSLGDYALVAARRVGLSAQPFPLILTGGVMRHPSSLLKDDLVRHVLRQEPQARLQEPDFEPVGGAVCLALAALGCYKITARTLLRMTLPQESFYAT